MKSTLIFMAIILPFISAFTSGKNKTHALTVKYTKLVHKNEDKVMRTSDVYVLNESDVKVTAIVKQTELGSGKVTEYTFRLKPGQESYAGVARWQSAGSPFGVEWSIVRDYKGWD